MCGFNFQFCSYNFGFSRVPNMTSINASLWFISVYPMHFWVPHFLSRLCSLPTRPSSTSSRLASVQREKEERRSVRPSVVRLRSRKTLLIRATDNVHVRRHTTVEREKGHSRDKKKGRLKVQWLLGSGTTMGQGKSKMGKAVITLTYRVAPHGSKFLLTWKQKSCHNIDSLN